MVRVNRSAGGEGPGGYLTSAVIFAGVTALWVFVVRDDPYYRFFDVSGVPLPVTTLVYLFLMPLAGFMFGRWRYESRHSGGAIHFAAKLVARAVHFTYTHSLIVLFTVAMATDYFLGLNIDEQVKSLDDRLFDVAARFAPWLSAYLAGFNLGRARRAWRGKAEAPADAGLAVSADAAFDEDKRKRPRGRKERAEPVLAGGAFRPGDESGDLGAVANPLAPGPENPAPAADAEPGFLPPQDLSKLRPTLRDLR